MSPDSTAKPRSETTPRPDLKAERDLQAPAGHSSVGVAKTESKEPAEHGPEGPSDAGSFEDADDEAFGNVFDPELPPMGEEDPEEIERLALKAYEFEMDDEWLYQQYQPLSRRY